MRISFDSQHVKGYQTLLKSARQQHFYHMLPSLWEKLSWKMSLLVILKIWRLFVNTLNVYDKHSLCNMENLLQPMQKELWKKWKKFYQFLAAFLKSASIFEHFEKRMTLIANVLSKLENAKDEVTYMSKKPISEHPSTVNILQSPQHCWDQQDGTFITFFPDCMLHKLSWKMSLWVIFEILGLFVNAKIAHDKYSLRNRGNFPQDMHFGKRWVS